MKKLMIRTKLTLSSGIYIIQSKSTGKAYIGCTKNFKERKESHFYLLQCGIHHCKLLQKCYDELKYIYEDDLEFGILEFCTEENIFFRELYYHINFHPELNSYVKNYKFSS